jgi:hypothetical protein
MSRKRQSFGLTRRPERGLTLVILFRCYSDPLLGWWFRERVTAGTHPVAELTAPRAAKRDDGAQTVAKPLHRHRGHRQNNGASRALRVPLAGALSVCVGNSASVHALTREAVA